jgi:putative transposase
MEVGGRRITHFNVTAHPTAEWRLQQFREAISGEEPYRYLIHDRDRIYSRELDSAISTLCCDSFPETPEYPVLELTDSR